MDDLEILNSSIDDADSELKDITARYQAGQISSNDWRDESLAVIAGLYVAHWLFGKRSTTLTAQERAKLDAIIQSQREYLDKFAEQLRDIDGSETIRRIKMYANSSRQAYEMARVYGIADLPAYPGDGSSECLSNCRCHWDIQVSDSNLVAYWRIDIADNCPTCKQRAQDWSPYIVRLTNGSK